MLIEFKFINTFICFPSGFNNNSFSFLTFKEILFALSQLDKFFKSILISSLSFLIELVRNKKLVSSAKWWTMQNFIAVCKSFVYSKNRRGPRTDP